MQKEKKEEKSCEINYLDEEIKKVLGCYKAYRASKFATIVQAFPDQQEALLNLIVEHFDKIILCCHDAYRASNFATIVQAFPDQQEALLNLIVEHFDKIILCCHEADRASKFATIVQAFPDQQEALLNLMVDHFDEIILGCHEADRASKFATIVQAFPDQQEALLKLFAFFDAETIRDYVLAFSRLNPQIQRRAIEMSTYMRRPLLPMSYSQALVRTDHNSATEEVLYLLMLTVARPNTLRHTMFLGLEEDVMLHTLSFLLPSGMTPGDIDQLGFFMARAYLGAQLYCYVGNDRINHKDRAESFLKAVYRTLDMGSLNTLIEMQGQLLNGNNPYSAEVQKYKHERDVQNPLNDRFNQIIFSWDRRENKDEKQLDEHKGQDPDEGSSTPLKQGFFLDRNTNPTCPTSGQMLSTTSEQRQSGSNQKGVSGSKRSMSKDGNSAGVSKKLRSN